LAERGSDPRDRRRNPVHITDKGTSLDGRCAHHYPPGPYLAGFGGNGEETAVQLRDLLRQLMQQFPEGRMVVALSAIPPDWEQFTVGEQNGEPSRQTS
jgi:DNA-binding MarR family transcriptional regulator